MSTVSAYAATPFNHKKADIILRSSDRVYFRVFKLFLSLASQFFETLFDIPQPIEGNKGEEVRDGLIVIPVTENSKTLDTLLRFCYPCTLAEDPKLEILQDLVDVLEAARKYSLDTIERKVLQALSNPQILKVEPFRCFAIARRGRAREETLLAAKYTLAQPLIPPWFQEINLITAADLLALLTYRQRCSKAVYALKADLSWIRHHYDAHGKGCPWISRDTRSHSSKCECRDSLSTSREPSWEPKWWLDFLRETFEALQDKPCEATIQSFAAKTTQRVKTENCPGCVVDISEGMQKFCKLLARQVEYAISKTELTLVS